MEEINIENLKFNPQETSIEEYEEALETIYSRMPYPKHVGAIPAEKWKEFLESQLKENSDLYIPKQVLRICEQLAVNNDINGALKVYDSMSLSIDDYDEVTKLVEEHFPSMGHLNSEKLGSTYSEFMVRANSQASYERTQFLNREDTTNNIKENADESDIENLKFNPQETSIEEYEKALETIYSRMPYPKHIGAIPVEKWKEFLESQLKENGDLYIPKQVLRIFEQLAVNNDINGALKVYDSMSLSIDDYDEVTKLVEEHFPSMGHLNSEKLGSTYSEFMVRANSQASYERTHYLSGEMPQITAQQIGKATINAPTTAKVEVKQVESDEQTKDNVRKGEEVGDDN